MRNGLHGLQISAEDWFFWSAKASFKTWECEMFKILRGRGDMPWICLFMMYDDL